MSQMIRITVLGNPLGIPLTIAWLVCESLRGYCRGISRTEEKNIGRRKTSAGRQAIFCFFLDRSRNPKIHKFGRVEL